MNSSPELPLEILLLIFELSYDVYTEDDIFNYSLSKYDLGFTNPRAHTYPHAPIAQVCRSWRDVSKPYVWKNLILRDDKDIPAVATSFLGDPSLSLHVRHLVITVPGAEDMGLHAQSIIRQCTSLKALFCDAYGTHLEPRMALLRAFPVGMKSLAIRFFHSTETAVIEGERTWMNTLVTVANRVGLERLHISHSNSNSPLFIDPLEDLRVPLLRMTQKHYDLVGGPHPAWYPDDIPRFVTLISKNLNIQRLEFTGIQNASDFIQALTFTQWTSPEERFVQILYRSTLREEQMQRERRKARIQDSKLQPWNGRDLEEEMMTYEWFHGYRGGVMIV
jgi:hypothetical protein